MQYEELIELLGEYCENNIPIPINSFINTVGQVIAENDAPRMDKETRLENIKNNIMDKQFIMYSCRARNGCRMSVKGVCINTKDGSKTNSILVTPREQDTIKIILISNKMYSGQTIYENKEEMILSDATRSK